MKTIKVTRITEEPKLKIWYDSDTEGPREWTNLGYFITVDRNYNSPDKNEVIKNIIEETGDEANNQAEHMELITKRINEETGEKVLAIYPVAKYEHSGIVYKLGNYQGFDYSNNGFYIVTNKTQKETGTNEKDFERIIKGEIDIYNKYVNGEVYGFTLYDNDGGYEDSCGGFYDPGDIREHLPEEWQNEDLSEYLIN